MDGWPLRPFSLLAARLNARVGVGEVHWALGGTFALFSYTGLISWAIKTATTFSGFLITFRGAVIAPTGEHFCRKPGAPSCGEVVRVKR
jgi:hypothetical protein